MKGSLYLYRNCQKDLPTATCTCSLLIQKPYYRNRFPPAPLFQYISLPEAFPMCTKVMTGVSSSSSCSFSSADGGRRKSIELWPKVLLRESCQEGLLCAEEPRIRKTPPCETQIGKERKTGPGGEKVSPYRIELIPQNFTVPKALYVNE